MKNGKKFFSGVKDVKVGYVLRPSYYKDKNGKLLENSRHSR